MSYDNLKNNNINKNLSQDEIDKLINIMREEKEIDMTRKEMLKACKEEWAEKITNIATDDEIKAEEITHGSTRFVWEDGYWLHEEI